MATTPRDVIDMVARDLCREAPLAFFGLAGLTVPTAPIRFEDSSVIVPELQADKLLLVDGPKPYMLYPEFQKKPADQEIMEAWAIKQLALRRRFEMPVCLVVFLPSPWGPGDVSGAFPVGLKSIGERVPFPHRAGVGERG